MRDGGWFRAAPGRSRLDPAVTGDPGHVPARPARAVDGKERKHAKAGGKKKVHPRAAVTRARGAVIGQGKVAGPGKAREVTRSRPLREPLPPEGALVATGAMQVTRANAPFLRTGKDARRLRPILGNQPGPYAAPGAPDWGSTPVAAATAEISHGRAGTRTIRALPAPGGTGFCRAAPAVLIGRSVTAGQTGKRQVRTGGAVRYITSLTAEEATPGDLPAFARGHWAAQHTHWLRDVIRDEDQALLRTGNAPRAMPAITNPVITLLRVHGVTRDKEDTRHNAQGPRRPLRLRGLSPG